MLRSLLIFALVLIALSVLSGLRALPAGVDAAVDYFLSLAWSGALLFVLLYAVAPGLFYGLNQELRQFWARVRHDRRELEDLHRKVEHLDKPHHMMQLGQIYLQQGRHRKAAAWLERALEKDPASLDARYKLALAYFAQQQHRHAASLLEQVHAAKPEHDYGQAFLRLAQCHHQLGNASRAAEVYERLLKYNAGHPEGTYHYALLLAQQGDAAEASKWMRAVVASVRRSVGFSRRRNRHWLWKARWWLLFHGKK